MKEYTSSEENKTYKQKMLDYLSRAEDYHYKKINSFFTSTKDREMHLKFVKAIEWAIDNQTDWVTVDGDKVSVVKL